MKRSKLNIFDYTDFRCFLRDRLGEMKEQDKKYSLRYLSNKMGLSSKSHLKMVADGARNLSPELAEQMAIVFGLNEQETGFFLVLIRFGQAKSLSEQQDALAELRKRRRFLAVHQLKLDRFDYLSDPLTLALREMITFADFQENPDWIQKRLPKKVSKKKIQDAIDKLLRIGLLFRQQDGSLAVAEKHQHTGDDFRSTALKLFYQNAFRQAAQSLTQPADERYLGGLTMAISKNSYEKIVDLYQEFITDVRSIVDEDNESNQVYQLVMGLFPLTKLPSDVKDGMKEEVSHEE